MKHRVAASDDRNARAPKHRRRRGVRRDHSLQTGVQVIAALASAVVVVVTGIGWISYRSASAGITKSRALVGEPVSPGKDENILIMGLDARRDQHGRLLAPDIYDALHAGGEDSGEGDTDALIVLHLPAGTAPATAISIPRDDYVYLAGCPTTDCRGKIKEAYRYAYQRVMNHGDDRDSQSHTAPSDGQQSAATEQAAREAGRKAEISTVKHLLQIPIDHFIEISLVAFYQLARVVEPITVCLNEDTSDRYYSGADFHQGTQRITAAQAMAFVRQRRDAGDGSFTDLDRTRRQQAFIASLVNALRHSGAMTNPARLRTFMDVAKQNVAVDAGFDLEGFVRRVSTYPDRPITLYTLPVTDFGEISDGEDVNFIDVSTIRSIAHRLVVSNPSGPGATSSTPAQIGDAARLPTGSIALDVVNASGRQGEAADIERRLATGLFMGGTVGTADTARRKSTIAYGPGAAAAAAELADQLGITTVTASKTMAANRVQLTVGSDLLGIGDLDSASTSPTTTAATPVTAVPATGTGTHEPPPTDLTRMTADDIPCVK